MVDQTGITTSSDSHTKSNKDFIHQSAAANETYENTKDPISKLTLPEHPLFRIGESVFLCTSKMKLNGTETTPSVDEEVQFATYQEYL